MTPGKGGDDKDNPLHFSGEIKDWPTFKEAIQSHADARDTTKTDCNRVPTSVDAYNNDALEEWFDDRDLATDLQMSLNKNRLGSNFGDHTKLGFKDAAGQ